MIGGKHCHKELLWSGTHSHAQRIYLSKREIALQTSGIHPKNIDLEDQNAFDYHNQPYTKEAAVMSYNNPLFNP